MNTTQPKQTVAYQTAYIAATDDRPKRNPYTKDTPRWREYERGYADGQKRKMDGE